MATTMHVSAPEEYADFLDDHDISQSQLFQSAVEERAAELGVDLTGYRR